MFHIWLRITNHHQSSELCDMWNESTVISIWLQSAIISWGLVSTKSMIYNNFCVNQSRFRLEVCSTKCWWCADKKNSNMCECLRIYGNKLSLVSVSAICPSELKHKILTSWRCFSFHPIYRREDWGMLRRLSTWWTFLYYKITKNVK